MILNISDQDKNMTEVKNDEEFSGDNVPKSNWMKFGEVGDNIIGSFVSKYVKPAEGVYQAQMVYILFNCKVNGEQMEANEEFNVGVTIREGNANFINNKFAKVKPGQRMGLKYEKSIPASQKGFNPAKSYLPNVFKNADETPKIDPLYNSLYGENFDTAEAVPAEIGVDAIPFN